MGMDPALQPPHRMTSLLFAIDYLKEMTGLTEITLMFDEEMPTNEEEILEQQLERVLVKHKTELQMEEAKEK